MTRPFVNVNLAGAALAAAQARGNAKRPHAGLTQRIRAALAQCPATVSELCVLLDVPPKALRRRADPLVGRIDGFKVLADKRNGEKLYAVWDYVEAGAAAQPPPAPVLPAAAAVVAPVAPVAAAVPGHQKFVRRDRDPQRQRCPACGSAQINRGRETFTCAYCRHAFAHDAVVTYAQNGAPIRPRARAKGQARSSASSGVIAPAPYRTGYRWGAGWL